MGLKRVTITGADDNTPVAALYDLSLEFPFVEWGILASRSQEGGVRFPSRPWIDSFINGATSEVNIAMHLCGGWVRELLTGHLYFKELPQSLLLRAARIQINTHAELHAATDKFFDTLDFTPFSALNPQWIFQLDGVNNHLLDAASYRTLSGSPANTAGLFDASHGAGLLPEAWPVSHGRRGYAGGLGPDNVAEQVRKIGKEATLDNFWIDMENHVRTFEVFDLVKVRRVLELTAPLIDTPR